MNDDSKTAAADAARKHKFIGLALVLCTSTMVSSYYLPLGGPAVKIVFALAIAVVEAFLVAGYLMHLISEKKLIYSVLLLTGVFFLCVLLLPLLAHADHASGFFK